uniref:NAD(P)-binding protein n=1 Tax=Trichogramma kaykai TaxID=54128 RepID=A0ABD2WL11_9HYME
MKFRKVILEHTYNHLTNLNSVILSARNYFSTSSLKKRRKSASCCRKPGQGPKIIVPKNCLDGLPKPIGGIGCKLAIVVGGSANGFGFYAARQLLANGAERVLLADSDASAGSFAAEKLCMSFGDDRAQFYPCDVRNTCHVEGIYRSALSSKHQPSIVFNDLDAISRLPKSEAKFCRDEKKLASTSVQRLTRVAIELLLAHKVRGIVINCASILGLVDWPKNPQPIYCYSDPVVETTINLANELPAENECLRLVALCPSIRPSSSIGLPDVPTHELARAHDPGQCGYTPCPPDPSKDSRRLGKAIDHLLARAKNGSAWLLEPPFNLCDDPKLITSLERIKEREQQEQLSKLVLYHIHGI